MPGVRVGHADDARLGSGVTAIVFDEPAVGSIDIRGGGPGTRETALLDPAQTVSGIDAITLSGGSAFGLDAASGVQAWLFEQGRGLVVRTARVPIVPAAILFDLLNGGDKQWGRYPPYRELGHAAAAAAGVDFALGSAGAGLGATTVNLKGGIGSASARARRDFASARWLPSTRRAASWSGTDPCFWAAPFERDRRVRRPRLPGRSCPPRRWSRTPRAAPAPAPRWRWSRPMPLLTKAQAKRLAVMAQTGFARAIHPVHTPLDGDVVFAVSTGRKPLGDPVLGLTVLGTLAADCLARAVARGVYEATALPFPDALPAWRDRFGRREVRP